MERRFSLTMNSPRLSNPMADSTRIDSTPNTNRLAALQLQKSLSPKQRSNSSICLSSSYTNGSAKHKELHNLSRTSTSVSKMTRQKLNLSQLDPKTYADVHSSGLASRIVKYHQESNTGMQRSMSFNNLHNPRTQMRRGSVSASPLSHKPNLPSLSMTRIAPPERSFYCGNTLPSLLRSNSVLGVEKSSEQLSRDRPIMHPTPLQHECDPTRSVLEELKEISRKRINSGDIQHNDYNSKKSCTRMPDFVDHHHHYHHYAQQQQQHQHLSMLQQPPSGFKRQRELSVQVPRLHRSPAVLLQHQQQHQLQHQHHQQLQQLQQQQQQLQLPVHHFSASVSPQQSPEQLAKRRNCSYSNDIASSLSSSKLHSNKRKLYDMRNQLNNVSTANRSGSSPETSPRQHAAKIKRKQPSSDLRLDHLSKTQSAPITPLPATPAQRTASAPVSHPKPQEEELPSKPKLTLFNTQQHQQQRQQKQPCNQALDAQDQALDLNSPDVDASEYAGIQFVKPKQQASLTGTKNSNIERTQKTKLAVMLSSLRGEIYQDETDETQLPDEPDATLPLPVSLPMPMQPIKAAPTSTTATAAIVATTAASVAAANKPTILSVETIVPAYTTTTIAAATTTTTTSNALPLLSFHTEATKATAATTTSFVAGALPGFKLPTTTTENKTPLLQFNAPTKSTTATATSAATAPTLTFGSLTAATTAATTTTSSTAMFSFGNAATAAPATTTASAAAAATPASTPAAGAAVFSFGQPATVTTADNAPAATTAAAASTAMFSFGNAVTAATVIKEATATTTTSAASAAPGATTKAFMFGNATSNNAAAATSNNAAAISKHAAAATSNNAAAISKHAAAATVASATPAFLSGTWPPKPTDSVSFNSNNNNNSFDSAFKTPTTTTTAAVAAQTAASVAEPQKLFGFGAASNSTGASVIAAPMFGTTTAAAATTKPAFSFGSSTNNNTTVAATTDATTNSSNIFSFGGAATTKPVATAAPFALANNSNNSSVFGFNAGNAATGTTTTETPATPNSFSFSATAAAPAAATNSFNFNAAPKPTSIFGSGSSHNNNNSTSKPFTFGGIAATPTASAAASIQTLSQPQQSAGGFSFGAAAQKTESTNVFGSPSSVKSTFNFGGNSTSGAATQQMPAPTFGGFSTPAPVTSNQNKPFAFGGNATVNNGALPMGGNLFASAVAATQNQQQQQPKPGGFSFSNSNNNNNNNSSAASMPNNSNTPFAFGGMTSPPHPSQNTNMVKPFAFGGNATNAGPSNMFGSPAAPPTSAPTNNGAFNFGGATMTAAPGMHGSPQQLHNNNNLFTPPSTPENRPIRRATRRLQK